MLVHYGVVSKLSDGSLFLPLRGSRCSEGCANFHHRSVSPPQPFRTKPERRPQEGSADPLLACTCSPPTPASATPRGALPLPRTGTAPEERLDRRRTA